MAPIQTHPFSRMFGFVKIILGFLFPWFVIEVTPELSEPIISLRLLAPACWFFFYLYLRRLDYQPNGQIGYFCFLLMVCADRLNFEESSLMALVSYLICSFAFTLCLNLVRSCERWVPGRLSLTINTALAIGYSILPIAYIVHAIALDSYMSKWSIYAILATNMDEAIDFAATYLSPLWIIPALGLIGAYFWQASKQKNRQSKLFALAVQIACVMALSASWYTWREHFRVYHFTENAIEDYFRDIDQFKATQAKFKSSEAEFDVAKEANGETYILIIGESLNRDHMHVFGYERETTPLLSLLADERQILTFPNTYASHPHTTEALSLSLTEANQINQLDPFASLSIINVLERADFETYWITNHKILGVYNNFVASLAHQADELITLRGTVKHATRGKYLDEDAIEACSAILTKPTEKNRLIVVHLYGNHWTYSKRYPNGYGVFPPDESNLEDLPWLDALKPRLQGMVNDYDNSVLYNDYVVASIIDELEGAQGVGGLLYFSDHGEDVRNGLFHSASRFNINMIKVPLIMWFSEDYREQYPDRYETLRAQSEGIFCNDSIYDTLMGIMEVQTTRFESSHDISSKDYSIDLDNAYALFGDIKYIDIPGARAPASESESK